MRIATITMLLVALATAIVLIPSRTARQSVTLTFTVWGMPFEDRLFLDAYAREFDEANPDLSVDYQRHADVNLKYNAWHARGRGADVMRIQITDYHQMVRRGMLLPLGQFVDDSHVGLSPSQEGTFPDQLWTDLHIDGEVYALPQDNAQMGLYYNRAIFDAHNEAHPDDPVPYPNADWTWQDLRDAARALTVRDDSGRTSVQGLDLLLWSWPFMNFFAQAGGHLWSDDGLTTRIASEAGAETLEFLHTLAYDDRSWEPYFGKDQGAGPDAKFVSGRAAMYFDGSWRVPDFEKRNPDLDFAVAPVPRGRDRAVVCGSCLWGISASTKHPDEAWRMLRWLVSAEQAGRYWDALRIAPPAHTGVMRSEAFRQTHGIVDEVTGVPIVPAMPRKHFEDRAAWLLYAVTPTDSGQAPGFVPTSPYQRMLEEELARVLQAWLRTPTPSPSIELLEQAAVNVHAVIDRDRAARGLPPAHRP